MEFVRLSNSNAPDPDRYRLAAQNRKARYDYFIGETLEAGIALFSTEVKSLRQGKAQLSDAFAAVRAGELYLINAHISEYDQANKGQGHEVKRPRKLLLHKHELAKIIGAIHREGMTAVPLQIHFNKRGIAKVLLGMAKGKKQHDKRATIKEREWNREKARGLKVKD
jgi:SsrA-binding protein